MCGMDNGTNNYAFPRFFRFTAIRSNRKWFGAHRIKVLIYETQATCFSTDANGRYNRW